jgi:hypothetical protein
VEREDFVCPNCGAEIEAIDEGYEGDEVMEAQVGIRVTMDEIVDYIFTQLVREGISPTGEEIFKVVMLYTDFLESRVTAYIKEVADGEQKHTTDNDHGV